MHYREISFHNNKLSRLCDPEYKSKYNEYNRIHKFNPNTRRKMIE